MTTALLLIVVALFAAFQTRSALRVLAAQKRAADSLRVFEAAYWEAVKARERAGASLIVPSAPKRFAREKG